MVDDFGPHRFALDQAHASRGVFGVKFELPIFCQLIGEVVFPLEPGMAVMNHSQILRIPLPNHVKKQNAIFPEGRKNAGLLVMIQSDFDRSARRIDLGLEFGVVVGSVH